MLNDFDDYYINNNIEESRTNNRHKLSATVAEGARKLQPKKYDNLLSYLCETHKTKEDPENNDRKKKKREKQKNTKKKKKKKKKKNKKKT